MGVSVAPGLYLPRPAHLYTQGDCCGVNSVDGDLIDHDTDGDCICGPTTEPVVRGDGSIVWLVVHHSLDRREPHEQRTAT